MESFIRIDELLIANYFEPLAWKFENKFGPEKDNFLLAELANAIYWALAILDPVICGTWERTSLGLDALFLFGGLYIHYEIRKWARPVRAQRDKVNPFRIRHGMRLGAIMTGLAVNAIPGNFGPLALLLGLFLVCVAVCGVYFLSCNPLPPTWAPKPKKKRVWRPVWVQNQ